MIFIKSLEEINLHIFNYKSMQKNENKINTLITWCEISRILSGSSKTIYSGRIPLIHKPAIDELKEFLTKWIDKYKK